MKTVYNRLESFEVIGIKPTTQEGDNFEPITEKSFEGKWKVIVFYPKVATFVCPTEIIGYDNLRTDFEDRDAVLMIGSTDNEFTHLLWKNSHDGLKNTSHWGFADIYRDERSLSNQLGVFSNTLGAALRATFIVDPTNVIQHVSVNNANVGRSPEETLRILDGIQTEDLCPCNRKIGGETL